MGALPDCVTVTVTGLTPLAVTVMLAVRTLVEALAVKLATKVPLPLPEGVTVHQAALLKTLQAVFEVTVNDVLPAEALTFWLAGVTASEGDPAAWVTVTATGPIPVTVTVIVAIRLLRAVFSVNVAVSVPLPTPEGVTVHQAALLLADQAELEVTVKVVFPAAAATFWFDGVTLRVGEVPA